jgi:hypothetical protein
MNEDGTPRLIREQETGPTPYDTDEGAFMYEDFHEFVHNKANTGEDSVNDLHIYILKPEKNKKIDAEKLKATIVSLDREDAVTDCEAKWDPKKEKFDINGCDFPAGKSVIVKITYPGRRIKIRKWYWTLNGKRKGKAFYGSKHHKKLSPITKKPISYALLDSPGTFYGYSEFDKPGGYKITTETSKGLHTAALYTAWGKINVNLPADIVGGETISGSVYTAPVGKTVKEKEKNLGELNKYVIEIEEIKDKQTPAVQRPDSWMIPKAVNAVHLVFKDSHGVVVGGAEVPVYPAPPVSSPIGFQLPGMGQAGNFLRVPGPFNGNFADTVLRIGGFDAETLAESPRGLIVLTPYQKQVSGPAKITLKEGNAEVSGGYRNISVHLAVGKTRLKSGETTTLTVTVTGLERLEDEVPLRLQNKSPGIISMRGGTIQVHIIRAGDIAPGGIYTMTRTLTGKVPGTFGIRARIYPELKQWAERLGSDRGKAYRKELTDIQEKEILAMPESHFITFTKKDLNTYKTGRKPSLWPGVKELAVELLAFLNTAKSVDQQWFSEIYVSSILKALRGKKISD